MVRSVAQWRRSVNGDLASLRWTDEHDGQLLIDSAIEITERGDGAPELREAVTKTANVRTVTLDTDTVEMIDTLRRALEPYGPWMCGLGPELVSPDRISWWWSGRARCRGSIRSGASTTCATGRQRSRSAKAMTSVPWPADSVTPTQR